MVEVAGGGTCRSPPVLRRDKEDCEVVGLGLDVGGAACRGCGGLARSLGSAEGVYEGVKPVLA